MKQLTVHHGTKLTQKPKQLSPAFTIVELLIVIVIIAILAAITIISYVGIQNRAKASAAQTLLSQTVSKVKLYAVDHSDTYPSSLSDAGITNTDGLQYSSSSSSPSTFCITATSQNVSYYQSSTTTAPTAGACPGHGVNGGGVVTNLVVNPNATLYTTWGVYSSRWWGSAPATGAYSIVTNASDGPVGLKTYARKTWSTTSSNGDTGYDVYALMSVSPGDQFAFSCYVRPSVNRSFEIGVYEHSPETTFVSRSRSASQSIPAGTWSRLTYVYTVPDGISYIHHWACDSNGSSSANWAVGSTLDATGFMVTKGSTLYNYADPTINSSWAWTGTPNRSTSTGPAP